MNKNTISNKQYQQYKKLLQSIAWSFHRTTGIDIDELIGEANIAFVHSFHSYQKNRAEKQSTFIQKTVSNHLTNYINKQARTCKSMEELTDVNMPRTNGIDHALLFRETLAELSNEAQKIVHFICAVPEPRKVSTGTIKKEMYGYGLTKTAVKKGLSELRTLMA